MRKNDFLLTEGTYLLNQAVGRPLKGTRSAAADAYFAPWEQADPQLWPTWLGVIDRFRDALATLFNSERDSFCPQTNVSSGLTKIVMSLPQLQTERQIVLMSEIDFPTIGFVLQQALPNGVDQIRFIPRDVDVTDVSVWSHYLSSADIGFAIISHAYSNTGQQAPVAEIVPLAKRYDVLTVLDVAQAAGIIPLDLTAVEPDFIVGVCVKWLSGGPGAGFLWVHADRLAECRPLDVGWFSHEQPFEFDIHQFRYHPSALRFWGGTPSIVPYAVAAHSVAYFAAIGSAELRAYNQQLIEQVADALGHEFVSPRAEKKRNGTMILNFGPQQDAMMAALQQSNIQVDQRVLGMRVSPHIYNDAEDIEQLLKVLKR